MILGHSNPAITRRIYAHVMKRSTAWQVENAADLINRHRRGQTADKAPTPKDEKEGLG